MGTAFAGPKVGRGAAYADIDNDGALDVLLTTNGGRAWLFHNQGGENHSLAVKLVGTKSNRNGIGAVVRVTSGGEKTVAMLRSGSSYLSQSELVLTFGLGSAAKRTPSRCSGRADRSIERLRSQENNCHSRRGQGRRGPRCLRQGFARSRGSGE